MATVVRELWGKRPPFLVLSNKTNLFELLSVSENNGIGMKVCPSIWYNHGKRSSFYTITKVIFGPVKIKYIIIYKLDCFFFLLFSTLLHSCFFKLQLFWFLLF